MIPTWFSFLSSPLFIQLQLPGHVSVQEALQSGVSEGDDDALCGLEVVYSAGFALLATEMTS